MPDFHHEHRQLGRSGIKVSRLGLGAAGIAGLYSAVSEQQAQDALEAALSLGINYFDVAPLYGHGLGESRVGTFTAHHEAPDIIVSTKAGIRLHDEESVDLKRRYPETAFPAAPKKFPTFDFSRSGVLASIDSSLERLQRSSIDIVYLHDPDDFLDQAMDEALPALVELREQGVIKAVGVGMNDAMALTTIVERTDVDCILVAGRYTLLDHTAGQQLLPLCSSQGIGVVLGGVFNSGALASEHGHEARYNYVPATPEVVSVLERLRSVCADQGVSLRAAALAFASTPPSISTVIVGSRSAMEVRDTVKMFDTQVPDSLWEALRHQGLLGPGAWPW